MVLKSHRSWIKFTTKSLPFLVFLMALCYPAYVCAHPQPEPLADISVTQVEKTQRITIELAEVAELDKVARFTQLLAKSPHLSDLQLTQVQLKADQPERSFVRWSAQVVSGTPDDLELELQSAADGSESLHVVHRQSHRGFVKFALKKPAAFDADTGELFSSTRRSSWSIQSGHGFD